MSFQMVLLPGVLTLMECSGFGTMSFQMVLLLLNQACAVAVGFGTMSFQMVLLRAADNTGGGKAFWNYVIPDGSTTRPTEGAPGLLFWNYVIPDGSTTGSAAETINC